MTSTLKIVDGNVVISAATGRPEEVTDKAKMDQELEELLGIEVLENGFGAGIDDLMGAVPDSPLAFSANVQRAVRSAISAWEELQALFQFTDRTLAERVAGIRALYVFPALTATGDKSKVAFFLRLSVVSAAGVLSKVNAQINPPQGG